MRQSRHLGLFTVGGIFKSTDFTYTGTYTWVDDGNNNFRLKFLTSGTFTPKKKIAVDIFLVGGGGGGGNTADNSYVSGAGGGGGYTGTWRNIVLNANQAYSVTIGAGGGSALAGGTSSAFGYGVSGAQGLTNNVWGGHGGCGGGAAGYNSTNAPGNGGSDGSNGGNSDTRPGGTGQGTTTREFGEAGATLYAGGGGGAKKGDLGSGSPNGYGGAGGGANGAVDEGNGFSAAANTGGGGGGAKGGYNGDHWGGWGGSGIAIIRNKR